MHFTFIALGSRGDIQPLIHLGRGLVAAGHAVRLASFPPFAEAAGAAGLAFHPIAGDPRQLVRQAGAGMLALVRTFNRLGADFARDLSDPRLGETDLFVVQLPLALYARDLAERFRRPLVQAAVIPMVPTGTMPMMGLPDLRLPGLNRLTYRLGSRLLWQFYRRVIHRWRRNTLGLPPISLARYALRPDGRPLPVVHGFSPLVVPRPADWPAHVRETGYWFPPAAPWEAPDALRRFLETGPAPLFIGFGSMPVRRPAETTGLLLEALHRTGQRAIIHHGWGEIGRGSLPDSVLPVAEVPYEWLFPRMKMIIHHGGSGTTAFALRAGVPSLVIPFLFDQPFWGHRLHALGVGPHPIPFRRLTAERLARAIEETLADTGMQTRAAGLGVRIRDERGVETAVRLIERMVSAGPGG